MRILLHTSFLAASALALLHHVMQADVGPFQIVIDYATCYALGGAVGTSLHGLLDD